MEKLKDSMAINKYRSIISNEIKIANNQLRNTIYSQTTRLEKIKDTIDLDVKDLKK